MKKNCLNLILTVLSITSFKNSLANNTFSIEELESSLTKSESAIISSDELSRKIKDRLRDLKEKRIEREKKYSLLVNPAYENDTRILYVERECEVLASSPEILLERDSDFYNILESEKTKSEEFLKEWNATLKKLDETHDRVWLKIEELKKNESAIDKYKEERLGYKDKKFELDKTNKDQIEELKDLKQKFANLEKSRRNWKMLSIAGSVTILVSGAAILAMKLLSKKV